MSNAGRTVLPPKKQGESCHTLFDFVGSLSGSETIATKVVTATVWSGVDPTPSAIISGAASSSGTVVTQLLTAGVAGCIYYLVCTITTSAGQTLQMSAYLAVLPLPVP